MEMDKADSMLHWIQLRRQCIDGKSDEFSLAGEFELVLLDSIRRSVHIVRRDTMIALMGKGDERFIAHFETFDETENWEMKSFT